MKTTLTVIFSLMLAITAAAQTESLATLPANVKFVSQAGGFSIWLPAKPTSTKVEDGVTEYRWDLKEASISIEFGTYLEPGVPASPLQHNAFLDGYKKGFINETHIRLVAEAPRTVGRYRGTKWTIDIPSRKLRVRDTVMTSGKSYFMMGGGAKLDVPGSEALVQKAITSLSFTTSKRAN